MVDESAMTERKLANLGDSPAWRALSSLDVIGDQMSRMRGDDPYRVGWVGWSNLQHFMGDC